MTTPTSSFKDTGRVGADVYIRDSDDQSLQMKALVYSVNYEAQEADIGLYPRRWGKFSMLHLPAVYRVTVPLTELSLEPHAGAAQVGYEDVLLQRTPADAVPWMDQVGRMNAPGCADPDVPVAAGTTMVGEDGVPEFGGAPASPTVELGSPAARSYALSHGVSERAALNAIELEKSKAAAKAPRVDMGSLKAPTDATHENPNQQAKAMNSKPLLFTKAEILARISDVEDSLKKLRDMVDKVLE